MRDGSAALKTGPLAAAVLAAASIATPVAGADCTCKGLIPATEACRTADWHRPGVRMPKTRDELEALIDDLGDGSDAGVACFMKTGCFKDEEDVETKLEPCRASAFGRYADLLDQAHDRMTKLGALAQVYGLYQDADLPEGVEKRLVSTATRMLGHESDSIVLSALLKMLETYDFETPGMVDLFLERMGSDDALLREMAFGAFQRASGATLPFDPHAPPEARARQIKDLKEWWSHQPHDPH